MDDGNDFLVTSLPVISGEYAVVIADVKVGNDEASVPEVLLDFVVSVNNDDDGEIVATVVVVAIMSVVENVKDFLVTFLLTIFVTDIVVVIVVGIKDGEDKASIAEVCLDFTFSVGNDDVLATSVATVITVVDCVDFLAGFLLLISFEDFVVIVGVKFGDDNASVAEVSLDIVFPVSLDFRIDKVVSYADTGGKY